jgi:hypothetical protein
MVKRRGPPSQAWRTFLGNHAPDIAAMHLFVVPTISFDLLYAFVIVRLDRGDLVWINVTKNPTAEWIARQITEAFPWDEAPKYLIRDRDRMAPSLRADCAPRASATGLLHQPRRDPCAGALAPSLYGSGPSRERVGARSSLRSRYMRDKVGGNSRDRRENRYRFPMRSVLRHRAPRGLGAAHGAVRGRVTTGGWHDDAGMRRVLGSEMTGDILSRC